MAAVGRWCVGVEGKKQTPRVKRTRREEWTVLLRDHHEGYVDWDAYENNQKMIKQNENAASAFVRGSVRSGNADTVLALDLGDIRKEYAQKMEHLATVWDGSTGETHAGYWLVDVTAAEVNGNDIVPVCQKLFSTQAKEYVSENAEILSIVDAANQHLNGRGIWTMDRGCDRKKLLEPLLDKHLRFVIRSPGERMVRDRRGGYAASPRWPQRTSLVGGGSRLRPAAHPAAHQPQIAGPGLGKRMVGGTNLLDEVEN